MPKTPLHEPEQHCDPVVQVAPVAPHDEPVPHTPPAPHVKPAQHGAPALQNPPLPAQYGRVHSPPRQLSPVQHGEAAEHAVFVPPQVPVALQTPPWHRAAQQSMFAEQAPPVATQAHVPPVHAIDPQHCVPVVQA